MTVDEAAIGVARGQSSSVLEYRRIASARLKPHASGGGDLHGVNRPLLEEMASSGLLPSLFPAELGGTSPSASVDAVTLCELREGLASESAEAESALALQGLGSYPILQDGTPESRERWIPLVASGRAIAAFALSEPGSGSDAAGLECVAEREGDGYRLTGVKRWISNAPHADFYTLFARTGVAGPRGVTAFVVPGDAEGLSGHGLRMLAPHPVGELVLDGVYVPASQVLGEVGGGFRVAMRTLDLFRPSVGANAVGSAQAALELALAYADSRVAFGQPIREFQAVSHSLAEMATKIQAARLLVYSAARAYTDGSGDLTLVAAMAKLYATEMAQHVIDSAIQIHGATALEVGHPLEAMYRDIRATRIYEGTSEIQRTIIARQLYR